MSNFSKELMDKYPNLFRKDSSGKHFCSGGIWLPPGWQKVVEDLCGSIDYYVQHHKNYSWEYTSWRYYVWNFLHACVEKPHLFIILKHCKRLNTPGFNKPWNAVTRFLAGRRGKYLKSTQSPAPSVTVVQIKEKMGGLRFYISGGDETVKGMIEFAEYMCLHTCEVTGKPGELHVRGYWYKTLAPELTLTEEYKGYVPVKR